MTNPIDAVKVFLWNIAIKKGIQAAVRALVSFICGVKMTEILSGMGITVDPIALAGTLTTLIMGGLTMLQNWLKVKMNLSWL